MWEIFLIALGLSIDAASVAISLGLDEKKSLLKNSLLTAVFFGAFQAFMPFLGWLTGNIFKELIVNYDHWLAFILLFLIGSRMIIISLREKDQQIGEGEKISIKKLFLLAIATSIDALVIGISFSFLKINIFTSIMVIGATTFLLSFLGYVFGKKLSRYFGKQAKIFGGVILIIIGLKILLDHLFLITF